MITGMHFDVTTKELREHLAARVEHHRERERYYASQEENFKDAPTRNMTSDPVQGLREAGKRHQRLAERFAFMEKHLTEGETYRLSDHELEQLEFLSSSRGY